MSEVQAETGARAAVEVCWSLQVRFVGSAAENDLPEGRFNAGGYTLGFRTTTSRGTIGQTQLGAAPAGAWACGRSLVASAPPETVRHRQARVIAEPVGPAAGAEHVALKLATCSLRLAASFPMAPIGWAADRPAWSPACCASGLPSCPARRRSREALPASRSGAQVLGKYLGHLGKSSRRLAQAFAAPAEGVAPPAAPLRGARAPPQHPCEGLPSWKAAHGEPARSWVEPAPW